MAGTRQRIVEASAALFMQKGYAGSGLKQISADSAAPFGSLYHFFPGGKEELAAETLHWSGRAYQHLVEAVIDDAPDIVSGVRDCFEGAAVAMELSGYSDACPIAVVALEVASTNEPLRRVTEEIFHNWLEAIASRLAAAGIAPARAGELATVLVAALEGGFLLSRAAKDARAMRAIGHTMVDLIEAEVAG